MESCAILVKPHNLQDALYDTMEFMGLRPMDCDFRVDPDIYDQTIQIILPRQHGMDLMIQIANYLYRSNVSIPFFGYIMRRHLLYFPYATGYIDLVDLMNLLNTYRNDHRNDFDDDFQFVINVVGYDPRDFI